jgi:antitoxin (DNA-binding transcriptional repressor) of toxin-antitoxin stability system
LAAIAVSLGAPAGVANQILSDKGAAMKKLTVTEVARNFSAVMDGVESEQEEIILMRNHKPIARLVPEPPMQNALEVLGAEAIRPANTGKRGTLKEMRDPWAF